MNRITHRLLVSQEEQLLVVKEMCTKNLLSCLWKVLVVIIMTDSLNMALAVDRVRNERKHL